MAFNRISRNAAIGFCEKLQFRSKGRKHWLIVAQDDEASSAVVAQLMTVAVEWNPRSVLALPTGRTPVGSYRHLVAAHRRGALDCSGIQAFNLDEFWGFPQEHPSSYAAYLHRHLLSQVNVQPENVHLLDGGAANPMAACRQHEEQIREAGGIDLAFLGIGYNGHIAFNEPGSRFDSRTRVVDLSPATVFQIGRSAIDTPSRALTMGIATIVDAQMVLLLATGAAKAEIVASALGGEVTPAVPASVLQRHPNLTVVLDQAAAAVLLEVLAAHHVTVERAEES